MKDRIITSGEDLHALERRAAEAMDAMWERMLVLLREADPALVVDGLGDEIILHITPGREAAVEEAFAVFAFKKEVP